MKTPPKFDKKKAIDIFQGQISTLYHGEADTVFIVSPFPRWNAQFSYLYF